MKLHELKPAPGSHRNRKRVGRGISAGQGKTSGKGQKGQFSRSSPNLPRSFEGGQMPLAQRLPKLRGFHNRFHKDYAVVNLGKLNRYEAGSTVDEAALRASGLVSGRHHGVKVLAAGEVRVPLHLHVHRISDRARSAVERAGGTVTLLELVRTEPVAIGVTEAAAGVEPAIELAAAASAVATPRAGAQAETEAGADTEVKAKPRSRAKAKAKPASDAAAAPASSGDDSDTATS